MKAWIGNHARMAIAIEDDTSVRAMLSDTRRLEQHGRVAAPNDAPIGVLPQ